MKCSLRGFISGVDEAGRGPLAGPVVSACVVWEGPPKKNSLVKDSKVLTEREREKIYDWIIKNAYRIGIGVATAEEIDELNILKATLLSMERAVKNTGLVPDLILVDGNKKPSQLPQAKCVVRGDERCFLIACASIVAKVIRDSIMRDYSLIYPEYGFEKNKGYATEEHRRAIKKYGISPIHRKSFKGVKEFF